MRRVSGARLITAMLFGIIGVVISLAIEAVIGFLREDWTNPLGIGLAIALAAFSGLLPLLQPEKSPPPAYPPVAHRGYPPPPGRADYPPARPRPARSRMPAVLAVLVLLLVCGGGGGAIAYGAQYAGGWLTGDENGPDILAEEASAVEGDLTLTVHRVRRTAHYTRVEVSAANHGSKSLRLPVFGSCQLTAAGGATVAGDDLHSDWADTVPAGGLVRGTIAFGRLPAGVSTVSLSFTHIFGRSGGSITVEDIRLTPPDAP